MIFFLEHINLKYFHVSQLSGLQANDLKYRRQLSSNTYLDQKTSTSQKRYEFSVRIQDLIDIVLV